MQCPVRVMTKHLRLRFRATDTVPVIVRESQGLINLIKYYSFLI